MKKKLLVAIITIVTVSTFLCGCDDNVEVAEVDSAIEDVVLSDSNSETENESIIENSSAEASEQISETEDSVETESSNNEIVSEAENESESESVSEATSEESQSLVSEKPQPQQTTPSGENNNQSGNTDASTTTSEAVVSSEFIALLNAKRAEAGLSPVSMDSGLDNTALAGARELQTNMSHQVAGGGYDRCNIGYMSDVSVQGMFDGWWNSEGHRAQMMDPYLTHASAAYCNGYIIYIGNIDEEAYLNSFDTPSTAPVTDPVNSTDVGGGQSITVEGTPDAVREATDEEISAGEQFGWW